MGYPSLHLKKRNKEVAVELLELGSIHYTRNSVKRSCDSINGQSSLLMGSKIEKERCLRRFLIWDYSLFWMLLIVVWTYFSLWSCNDVCCSDLYHFEIWFLCGTMFPSYNDLRFLLLESSFRLECQNKKEKDCYRHL